MSACSAACTAPTVRDGAHARADEHIERDGVPARPRGELPGREVERDHLEDLVGRRPASLVRHQAVQHRHRTQVRLAPADRDAAFDLEDGEVGLLAWLGVLVGVVRRLEDGHVVLDVEGADAVLATLVQVDRTGVGDVEDARGVDRADHTTVGFDELVLERRAGAQADPAGRRLAAGPVHPVAPRLEEIVEHQLAHRVVEGVAEVPLVGVGQRQLVRGARDLGAGDERVVGVDHRGLGRAGQQLARMACVPLVELVVAGDEHGRGASGRAAGTPDLLAHRRQRAGEPVQHDGVERTDVDAELERARGHDAAEVTARESGFELAPFGGEVAGAVRGDRRRCRGAIGARLREQAACVRGDELGALATARERERLVSVVDEAGQQHRGLEVGRGAGSRVLVEQRTLPDREAPLGLRRAVAVDRGDGKTTQPRRELRRIADRGAGEAERGLRSVVARTAVVDDAARARHGCRRRRATCGARRSRRIAGA